MKMDMENDYHVLVQPEVVWHCRFHPTDWFHEVGCPHYEWADKQLMAAGVQPDKVMERQGNPIANSL